MAKNMHVLPYTSGAVVYLMESNGLLNACTDHVLQAYLCLLMALAPHLSLVLGQIPFLIVSEQKSAPQFENLQGGTHSKARQPHVLGNTQIG
jgi:hypothetical protein